MEENNFFKEIARRRKAWLQSKVALTIFEEKIAVFEASQIVWARYECESNYEAWTILKHTFVHLAERSLDLGWLMKVEDEQNHTR